MAQAANLKTGPCEIILDATNIGHTEGDATFNPGIQTRERLTAKWGENVVDLIQTGAKPTVTVRIAETTLANAQLWWPEGSVTGNTLYFGYYPGKKSSDYAKRLTLRPLRASSSNDEDIVLFKAIVQERAEVGYNTENDKVWEITFLALVDESKAVGKALGYMNVPTGS